MNGIIKRSYHPKSSAGAGKSNAKFFSTQNVFEENLTETDLTNIPLIKQGDNSRLLPKYTQILAKFGDDGVSMDELDLLQTDLEKLLCTSASRIRYLRLEIGEATISNDPPQKKAHEKTSLKRKRPDEKPKSKDLKNGMRVIRKSNGLTVNKFIKDSFVPQIPKVSLPKNDNSDKFWTSIEPFCSNITKDDLAFLESLIHEFSKEIEIKIPEIGEHYANTWSEEVINEECNLGKSASKKSCTTFDLKKNEINKMVEAFSTPQTQKLIGSVLEDRILNALPKNGDNGTNGTNIKLPDLTKLKSPATNQQKVGLCLDKRLKKEMIEKGFIKTEDVDKEVSDDEILKELKKCHHELLTVNDYNIEELKKLKTVASNELHSNELKDQLDKVDKQMLELYNKIIIMRKKARQDNENDFEAATLTEQLTKEFEAKADALLKQQFELNRQINGLIDMSY